jgi:hypothetical protein
LIDLVTLIAFITFSIVVALLIVDNVRVRLKRKKTLQELLQQTIDKTALLGYIEKLSADNDSKTIEQTEGFLKFVSDSRDWAFDYIEQVQTELSNYSNKVDADMKYIAKYGSLIEHPLQEALGRISEAYDELKKLLPENDK